MRSAEQSPDLSLELRPEPRSQTRLGAAHRQLRQRPIAQDDIGRHTHLSRHGGPPFRQGSLGGAPSLDLASEVELVRHAARVAPVASLVHDVAEGGLAVALAEAALWSGVGASLELDDDPLTLFGEVGGQVVVAVPAELAATALGAEVEVRRIGTVGGGQLLGIALDELRDAYGGSG